MTLKSGTRNTKACNVNKIDIQSSAAVECQRSLLHGGEAARKNGGLAQLGEHCFSGINIPQCKAGVGDSSSPASTKGRKGY